jgi:hypothetical protein
VFWQVARFPSPLMPQLPDSLPQDMAPEYPGAHAHETGTRGRRDGLHPPPDRQARHDYERDADGQWHDPTGQVRLQVKSFIDSVLMDGLQLRIVEDRGG